MWLTANYYVLLTAARRVLANPRDCEDAAQDSALRLVEVWDRYDAARGTRFSWAYTIAHRKAIDLLRTRHSEAVALARLTVAWRDQVVDASETATERAALGESWALMNRSERATASRMADGWSEASEAVRQHIPRGTLKTRRRLLRQWLVRAGMAPAA